MSRGLYGQCTVPEFSLPETACRNESLALSNETAGDFDFQWDFCAGDLRLEPVTSELLSDTDFFRARSLRVVRDADNWYGFAISATGNILMRLDFGTEIGSVPTVTKLGNISGSLSSAFAFDAVNANGTWHLFVANSGAKNVLRLSFDSGIEGQPTANVLSIPETFDAAGPNFIRIVKDADDYYAFVSVGSVVSDTKMVRLYFAEDVTDLSPVVSEFVVAGSNQLRGLSFAKECDEWIGLALSTNTNSLIRMAFGADLSVDPTISTIDTQGVLNTPVNIELRNEWGEYYAFIQNARIEETNAALYRISFGESIRNTSVETEKIQAPELIGGAYALDIVNTDSKWIGFTFNLGTRNLVSFSFVNNCSASLPSFLGAEPPLLEYSQEGKYYLTLQATDAAGNSTFALGSVLVQTATAPTVTLNSENVCAGHEVNFSLDEIPGEFSATWEFGDGSASSNDQSPAHVYSIPGQYHVAVEVTDANGCSNSDNKTIDIYSPPVAEFELPPGVWCTNGVIEIANATLDDHGGNLAYEWFVNGSSVSVARDLNYTFVSPGSHEFKLVASIEGCQSEATAVVADVGEGAPVDFSVSGQCEGEEILFDGVTEGTFQTIAWDFGDGTSDTNLNTSHVYEDHGQMEVALTLTSADGCQSTRVKEITVFSRPAVAFQVATVGPYCTSTALSFENLTPDPDDSDISSWLWSFGEGSASSLQAPFHTYDIAGNYLISLSATSTMGCNALIEDWLSVDASPEAEISHTPVCLGEEVTFEAPGDGIATWLWDAGDGVFTGPEFSHTFASTGDHAVHLTIEGVTGCSTAYDTVVHVSESVAVDFVSEFSCAGQEAVFIDLSSGEFTSREWIFDGVSSNQGAIARWTFHSAGEKTVTLEVTTPQGCIYGSQQTIEVDDAPLILLDGPATACRNELVQMTNTTAGEDLSFEWDFCGGDLGAGTSTISVLSHDDLFRARSLQLIEEEGSWYGFAISATMNTLLRLDFGTDLESTPHYTNLGNVSGLLSSAWSFDMIKVDDVWHMWVANAGDFNIVRLSFADGITQQPMGTAISTGSAFSQTPPNAIRIIADGATLYGFVTVGTTPATTKIVRLTFGTAVENTSPTISEIEVPGANQLRGIDFMKECGVWFGFALSYGTNELYRLAFGDLNAIPEVSEIDPGVTLNQPVNIELREEAGRSFAFIQNARIEELNAALYRIEFGSLASGLATGEILQSPVLTGGAYALDLAHSDSRWYAYSVNLSTKSLVRFDFEDNCSAGVGSFLGAAPPALRYSEAGVYHIILTSEDPLGNRFSAVHEITVSSNTAPDIDFSTNNVCVQNDIDFVIQTQSDDLAAFAWDFGDGSGTSVTQDPSYQYASPGTFEPRLEVTAANGCHNSAKQTLTLYPPPLADFQLPSGVVCTNNEYTVVNLTDDIFDGHLTFQWSINGAMLGSEENLVATFATTGQKNLKLVASIPGCSDESEKIIPSVGEGPVVAFTTEGHCQDTPVLLEALFDETVVSQTWDFGDGDGSPDPSVVHTFSNYGEHHVSLTATKDNGCTTTHTEALVIYEKPSPFFDVEGPPSSCAADATQFINTTPDPDDSAVETWAWAFGDPLNSTADASDPTFVYGDAGSYVVSLTATTDKGCIATLEKQIEILPAPTATITQGPACLNVPASFEGTGEDIGYWYWETGTAFYEQASFQHTFQTTGEHVVNLFIEGVNGCVEEYEVPVNVPEPLLPDFSYSMNCVGFETAFTAAAPGDDPVAGYAWDFDGRGAGDSPVETWTFDATGEKTVILRVTTESGCTYTAEKTLTIVPAPVADFSTSAETGGTPFKVQFTNLTQYADNLLWNFGDAAGTTSSKVSPEFVFTEVGAFDVVLTASNDEGCTNTTSRRVSALEPVNDVALRYITAEENSDGTFKLILTLENVGNTRIENLPVVIDLAGQTSLVETVSTPILPAALYNLVASYNIRASDDLTFLCAQATLPGDTSPENDRACVELADRTTFLPPHPNPVKDLLTVEWVSPAGDDVRLWIADAYGRIVFQSHVTSTVGLNTYTLNLGGNSPGVYLLRLEGGSSAIQRRILISR